MKKLPTEIPEEFLLNHKGNRIAPLDIIDIRDIVAALWKTEKVRKHFKASPKYLKSKIELKLDRYVCWQEVAYALCLEDFIFGKVEGKYRFNISTEDIDFYFGTEKVLDRGRAKGG